VNVVLDLMIHDIDLVQSLAGSDIVSIDAVGTPVFTGEIDFANARLRFANGCVANITASRVSLKTERKLRIFEEAAYISLDLQQKILTLIRKRDGVPQPGHLPVSIEEANLEQGDALKSEIESFIDCIRNERRPIVSGEDGLRALETAIRITEQVHANRPGNRKTA
jgi:predicted dehydrogenase